MRIAALGLLANVGDAALPPPHMADGRIRFKPHTEFSAEYGPVLTYTPLYMYWLLKPLGVSHEQAYFACHSLLNLGGLLCLYYVLSRVTMPTSRRLIAFAVLALAGFAPHMDSMACS